MFEKSKEESNIKTKSKTTWAHCCFWGFDLLIPVYGNGGVCIAWWRGMGRVLEKDKQTNRRGFYPVTLQGLPAPFHSSTYKINSTCDPSWAAALQVEAMLGQHCLCFSELGAWAGKYITGLLNKYRLFSMMMKTLLLKPTFPETAFWSQKYSGQSLYVVIGEKPNPGKLLYVFNAAINQDRQPCKTCMGQ